MKKILEKLHIRDNAGSTMVEVLAGFTILVIVLVECSVHLLGAAGNMIMKAKDMQSERQTLNEELYKKDVNFVECTSTEEGSNESPTVTLTPDKDRTNAANIDKTNNALFVTIPMDATAKRYYNEDVQLAIVHIVRKQPTP